MTITENIFLNDKYNHILKYLKSELTKGPVH